ncbi:RNA polymerase-associated protein RapA, partial [Alteromonas sp. 14N.309.X.WAT.G.H12]
VLQANAERVLQPGRFLPATPIRIFMDAQGNPVDLHFEVGRPAGRKLSQQLIKALQQPLTLYIEKATAAAQHQADEILSDAIATMQQTLNDEAQRLRDLQQQNPAIRDSEIDFIDKQRSGLTEALRGASVQLDGLRIVVNNP